MSFDTHFSSSPYPGLRPFEPEECDIFFGREGQTDELLARLQKHRFVAVVGPSGCGKSSLVYAGMIPALKTGFICDAGPDWRILQMRPGERPMGHLAAALLAWHNAAGEIDASARLLAEAALRRGPLGLVELARETRLCDGANLLVLVDQFEELFRFREKVDPDDADAFVALLLATAAQKELPIYIVITMRSDFLGDCAIFHGLPEAINESQYLTPRLTREQCSDAICGPARVFGGDADEKLLNRLLNDFGPDPDQLPVLQHALMRMWQRHVALAPAGGAAGRIVLTLDDYESPEIGGLRHALSWHGEEVMRELTAEQQRIAQFLFRRLTERGKGRRDTRSPARVEEVAAIAGVGIEDIKPVVDVFRRADRSFLMPREGEPLQPDTFLDIGHESLIRQWDTLAQWMDEEAESAEVYLRLKETARLWKTGYAALWGTPDLERALEWRRKIQPGPGPGDTNSLEAWASRYGSTDDLRLAQEFLVASQEKYRRDQEELEEANRRTIRRARLAAFGFAVTAIVVIAGVLLYFYLYSWDHAAFYNSYVKVRGAPQGIGELSSEQVKRRPMSLKIVRRGRLGPVLRAEAVDRKGEPTREHYIGTYLKASGEGGKPEDVRWEFTYDSNDQVAQETAYDLRGNRVWAFVYLPQKGEDKQVRTAYFVGPDGYPRSEKEYAGNVVHIEYDEKGHERVLRYRSRGLKPARGPDKAFGHRLEYKNGNITKYVSLGPDDQPLNDEAGNAILEVSRIDSLGNSEEVVARDAAGELTVTTQGWSIRRSAFDSAGNIVEQSYFGPSGAAVHNAGGYHRITWKRDERGNVVEIRYWDAGGSPAPGEGGCFGWTNAFDARDNPVRGVCIGPDGQPAFHAQGYASWEAQYDANRNIMDWRYFDPAGNPTLVLMGYARVTYGYDDKTGQRLEEAYYSTDGSPAVSNEGYARIVCEYDGHGRMSKRSYYGTDGKLAPSDKGYATIEWGYDAYGNTSEIRYFGSDGKRAIGEANGIAGWKARHDAGGRQIEVMYLDSSDKPMVSSDGMAGFRWEYDEAGNKTRYSDIGLKGEACLRDGVAGWISSFDPLGKELERRYLGLGGEPVSHKDGYARWTARYDARGNRTELGYYDTRGKSVMVPLKSADGQLIHPGRARDVYKYNAQSRLTEEAYWGSDGKPASTKEGWARAAHEYDLRGNRVRTRYYGSDNKPVRINRGYYSVGWRHNNQGKDVKIEYFSQKEEPAASVDGYAQLTRDYNRFGRVIIEKVFDIRQKPTVDSGEGVHRRVHRYSPRGLEIEVADYDTNEKPVLNLKHGCHILKYDYDPRGRVVEQGCFGKNHELIVNKQWRAASVKFTYDAQGRTNAEDYFDENKTSVGSWRYRYDSYGKLVDKSWNQAVKPMGPSVDGSQRP